VYPIFKWLVQDVIWSKSKRLAEQMARIGDTLVISRKNNLANDNMQIRNNQAKPRREQNNNNPNM
ncbi:unnamed protein product, partial [Sphenostylis stenocarpa]